MNGTWSFVNEVTGETTGQTFSGPAHALADNTPPGCRAVEGLLPHVRHDDPELRRSRIVERIEALERKELRPLRELRLDPSNAEATAKLQAIESEIAQLRGQL